MAVNPHVDLIVLARAAGPLHAEVERGIRRQRGVELAVHRVIGESMPGDRCRWDAIARARNQGKLIGTAPWLMFLDDDVVLASDCIAKLVAELRRRPAYAALGADYLGQYRAGRVSPHVSMGATIFRREALEQIRFAWREKRCECQCCCDDLRRNHWAIDYYAAAKARHLPKGEIRKHSATPAWPQRGTHEPAVYNHHRAVTTGLPSVCLVACYLGPPPGWIDHYLRSCAYNPSIDFLIVTDQAAFPPVPPNVRVKQLSESSFNALATKTLEVDVRLSHPRKLCDFKPTYGHLFQEELRGYDYWGYTDLDVIYGDIRRFLSLAKLQKCDVFTARKEFLVGHFTLFRNTSRMMTLYRQGINYRAVLQSPDMLSFSECGKQWRRRMQQKPLTDDAACDSMMHIILRQMATGRISACFDRAVIEWIDFKTRAWRLRWHAGRLWSLHPRREVMYFHFNAFRRRRGYRQPLAFDGSTAFDMTLNGFEPARDCGAGVPPACAAETAAPQGSPLTRSARSF